MKSAYKQAKERAKKPPKGWKRNKGKCRLRMIQFRVRIPNSGQEGLLFFCTRKSHWHGEAHPFVKSIRADDIFVLPETLYREMTHD
jgi:hypothetical protein